MIHQLKKTDIYFKTIYFHRDLVESTLFMPKKQEEGKKTWPERKTFEVNTALTSWQSQFLDFSNVTESKQEIC